MKIKALAPWYGGKRSLAQTIVEELGEHKSFWDPACGGMSILFAKERSAQEAVNDLHGQLTNMAWVLQSHLAVPLYERLQRTLFSEELVSHAETKIGLDFTGEPPDLDAAYYYFILSWAGRNGVSGTMRKDYGLAVRFTNGGGSGGVRFRSAIESIPAWHQRLQH